MANSTIIKVNCAHTIENSAGTDMTQRDKLQIIGGTMTDDSTNDKTVVTLVNDSQSSSDTTYSSQKIEQLIESVIGVVPVNPASTAGLNLYIETDDPAETNNMQLEGAQS